MPFVDLSVWIQTPSFVLVAVSEILASITGLEYAFTKAPKSMRSLVMVSPCSVLAKDARQSDPISFSQSVFLFQSAIASALGQAFLPLSADPLLVWNYGVSRLPLIPQPRTSLTSCPFPPLTPSSSRPSSFAF